MKILSGKFCYKSGLKLLAFVIAVLYYNNSGAQENVVQSEEERVEAPVEEMTYSDLLEEYEKMKIDRDNILIQTRKLLQNKREYEMGLETFTVVSAERKKLFERNQELEKKIIASEAEIEVLEEEAVKLEIEKNELQDLVGESKAQETVKNLIDENKKTIKSMQEKFKGEASEFKTKIKDLETALKEENKKWISERRSLEKEVSRLENKNEKAEKQEKEDRNTIVSLNERIEELEQGKKEVEKALLDLERRSKKIPVDFKNLARHNEILTKQLADVHYNMGVVFCNQGEFRRAIAEYEEVIKIKPRDKDAIYNLGLIYAEHMVDRDKAIKYFKRYIQIDNKSTNAEWAKTYIVKWESWQRESEDILQ